MPDSLRPFDDTGIIVMKTVDVRPDLDLFSLDAAPTSAAGIVRCLLIFRLTDFAVSIPADKALGNDQGVGVRFGQLAFQVLPDIKIIRFAVFIDTHIFQG